MNCRDFREIADSYLSDELMVETNHGILRHLEDCPNCRRELAARRNLRRTLQTAIETSPESKVNPVFAGKLKRELREKAFKEKSARSFFGTRLIFTSACAVLIFGAVFGLMWRQSDVPTTVAVNQDSTAAPNLLAPADAPPIFQAAFIKARQDAVDDHKYCALQYKLKELPISLEESARLYDITDKDLDATVMKTLRTEFGESVRLVKAHSCVINGRRFAHVIVEYQNKIVSVLLTTREKEIPANAGAAKDCQNVEGLHVSCFETVAYSIFVISDLPETENTLLARILQTPLVAHLEKQAVRG